MFIELQKGVCVFFWVRNSCFIPYLLQRLNGLASQISKFSLILFIFGGGGGVRGAWREELVENIVLGSFGFCNLE